MAVATSLEEYRVARIAGVLYLVIIVCGIGGQALVREPMLANAPAQTVANLIAGELSFRLSILADVAMVLADVALGVVLYVLLAPVSRTLSLAAMAFRLAQAAVLALNLQNLERAISLATGPLSEVAQRDALVQSHLDAYAAGYDLGLFLFAVNCVLVGVLLWRSGFVPRIIGGGIAVTGAVYGVGSTLRIVAPALADPFATAYVVPVVAELTLCGWLLSRRSIWSRAGGARWSLLRTDAASLGGGPGPAGGNHDLDVEQDAPMNRELLRREPDLALLPDRGALVNELVR